MWIFITILHLFVFTINFNSYSPGQCQCQGQSQPLNPQSSQGSYKSLWQTPSGSLAMMTKIPDTIRLQGNGGTVLEGDVVYTSHLLVQRVTPQGTAYCSFKNPSGQPLYKRPGDDSNLQFVTFSDPKYPEGSGRYVVLKKVFISFSNLNFKRPSEPLYQGFYLVLTDSMYAYISKWQPPPDGVQKYKSPAHIVIPPAAENFKHPTFDIEWDNK